MVADFLQNNDDPTKIRIITSMARMERNGRTYNDRAGREFAEFVRYQCGLHQIPILVYEKLVRNRGTANQFVTTFAPAGYTYLNSIVKDYIKPLGFGSDTLEWAGVII
jgi:hypothetical protein